MNQNLQKENQELKNLLNQKDNNSTTYNEKSSNSIEYIIQEADEALDRFHKKLQKERKKYAKQKQSKR
jgi:hypothetical protein